MKSLGVYRLGGKVKTKTLGEELMSKALNSEKPNTPTKS